MPQDKQYVARHIFLASVTVVGVFKKVFPNLSKTDSRCAHLKAIKVTLAPRLSEFCAVPE